MYLAVSQFKLKTRLFGSIKDSAAIVLNAASNMKASAFYGWFIFYNLSVHVGTVFHAYMKVLRIHFTLIHFGAHFYINFLRRFSFTHC